MKCLGVHLLVEMKNCSKKILMNVDKIKEIMIEAATKAGAIIIVVSFHKFNPFGISGVVVIAESHLAIHTWPEYKYAAADIFTCGEEMKPEVAAHYLIKKLRAKDSTIIEVKRGILLIPDLRHKVSLFSPPPT